MDGVMHQRTTEKLGKENLLKNNKSLILKTVWAEGSLSRLEISRRTGLSTATVSRLVDALIHDHLLAEKELIAVPIGRPMKSVCVNGKDHYLIAVDLGTTSIRGVLTNLTGEPIKEVEVITESHKDAEHVLGKVVSMVQNLAGTNLVDTSRIVGIGLAVAGIINLNTGIVEYSPAFNWRNIPIRKFLEERVPFPVFFDNVSRAMALGEITFGHGRRFNNLICINVGYGIGAGIVLGKKLFYGTDGMAGEFGHIPVIGDEAIACTCGKHNCLTAYASGEAIAQLALLKLKNPAIQSRLRDISPAELEARHIADAAQNGDALATEVFNDAIGYLGRGIAGLMNIFNPEAVIIGGGISQNGDVFWNKLRPVIDENVFDQRSTKYQILPTTYPGHTALYGALAMVLHEILALNLSLTQ